MLLVDMVCTDRVRVLLGLLVLTAISLAEPEEASIPDLERMQQPEKKIEPSVPNPSGRRSDQYVDEYESTEERIELDHSPVDSQRHKPHLQDEYHEKQTIEYMDDAKVPQAYTFGFEIKDDKEGSQYRHEQKDAKGNVQGRFGYRDAKGQYREVDYVADDYGFRAKIKTNEAGVLDQHPADVKIEKDQNEAQIVYPQHSDINKSVIPNTGIYNGKTAELKQYHHQSATEVMGEPGYENQNQQSLSYESHSRQPQEHLENNHQSKVESPKEEPTAVVHRYFLRERDPHEHTLSQNQYQNSPDVIYQQERPKKHSLASKEYQNIPDIKYQREQPMQHVSTQKDYQSGPDVIYHREMPKQHDQSPKENQISPDVIYEQEQPQEHGPSPKEYRDSPETVYKREPIHEDCYNVPDIVYKPEHEHNTSPKYYHDVPETTYKKRHSQNQKVKPNRGKPSTYQYELDTNGYSYRYPQSPSSQTYQSPPTDAYNAYEKEYPANKYRQQIPDEYEVSMKEDRYPEADHEGSRNPNVDKNDDYHSRRVVLPQAGDQNSPVYDVDNKQYHAQHERHYPVQEGHILNYNYEGENKIVHPESPKDIHGHVPITHQYIRVIEEPQPPASASFEKEKHRYIHRPIIHLRPDSQPHSVVVLDPRNQIHQLQHELVYGDRTHEQPRPHTYHAHQHNHPIHYEERAEETPKISHRESSRPASKHDGHQQLQKAVLELNSDVYKELLEHKSPGRIVAVPVNQLSNGHHDSSKSHLHLVSGKPHGVLHIPLDDKTQSTIDLKNLPLVVQIPDGKVASYQKAQDVYHDSGVDQDKVPIIYAHSSRSPAVSVPKSSGRLNKNKEYEKSKWIPMAPSWRNKQGVKSHESNSHVAKYSASQESGIPRVAVRLSDGGLYQILQTESSERLSNIRKKPSKSKAAGRASSRSRKLKAKQSSRASS